ncbi:MAG: DUF475 domain-containing protein [Candidatus Aenigmarchaeota archaeon]|nr:DUF475 domain-containing protein [Candidatus Aenigmarchaeota archaeon]
MTFIEALLIIFGLTLFEIVNSIDNAIINAHVLRTMSQKWRKMFLYVGIITSVFLVRLILPLLIVWLVIPHISLIELLKVFTGGSTIAAEAIEQQKPIILIFGGMFMVLLYFHWLFMERKHPLFIHERLLKEHHDVWFFAFAAILLVVLLYFARGNPTMMLATSIGSAAFFIIYGFKETAERKEEKLMRKKMSNVSKFMYLEVLDATFSFDGVVGAFAFTTNLLYIVIGLGIGAIVLRELTILGIDKIAKYRWLKNGAMTAIGFLGIFMILESFHIELPIYLPTLVTSIIVGYAFYKSHKHLTGSTLYSYFRK